MRKYAVKEIFGPTIQGEGSETGRLVSFLRFAGCNKWTGKAEHKAASICNYCDTDFVGGIKMTAQEIKNELLELKTKHVVISGGEPTLQLDKELLETLEDSFFLHLETNGSKPLGSLIDYFYHISVSPKQSYKETKIEGATDLKILWPYIGDGIDPEGFAQFKCNYRYLQPINNEKDLKQDNIQAAIELVMRDLQHYKLSIQLHKVLGVK